MTGSRRLAAIDIGTVTTRLLVADVDEDSIAEVDRSTDITHLGQGLTETGRLDPSAMERVAAVIARYAQRMDELGTEHWSAVATSASRDADNASELLALLASHGVAPAIIDGGLEAELSFGGATAEREGEGLLVVDCGGGSTELVLGDVIRDDGRRGQRIVSARSIDIGSRRMTELFLSSDPPTRSELDRARAWATGELRGYFDRLSVRPNGLIAVAGTATTLAAIRQELALYDPSRVHGFELSGSDLSDLLEMLSGMPLARRKQVAGLHPDRAGVIVAGALILETTLALAGLDRLVVSEHDILYGILRRTYSELQESGS